MPRASSRRAAAKAAKAASGNSFELQMALAMSLSEPSNTNDTPPPAKLRKAGDENASKDSTNSSSSAAASSSTINPSTAADSSSGATTQGAAAEDNYVDPLPPTLLVIDRERPLKSLGESGLIPFGEKVLHMKYKEYEWWADVRPDGTITHHGGDGTEYVNPSSFSLAMKRQVKASVVSDSGWESLKYNGRKLSHVRDGVETLLRQRKERRSRTGGGHIAGIGLSKAQQTAIFKGLDRKKEALVKEVITHYNVTKVEDNAAARLKRRQKQSKRNYEHLAKIMKKLKQKDRYAFFQDDDLRRTNPAFESSIPHPYIDFRVMDQRYRASKRVFASPSSSSPTGGSIDGGGSDEGLLYMALALAGDGSGTGIAEIKYDRLLRDVTQIAENAQAFFPPSDDPGTAYFEAGWMLVQCKQVISSFQKRVTQTLSAQRRKDLLEMIREKNRQPCVQGKWHKMPYSKREYRAITAYEPSGCLHPREAERVMRKLKTSMTREDFVAAVEKEDWDLQRLVDAAAAEKKAIADAVEAHRLRRLKLRKNKNATSETSESTSDPTTADASDPKAENSSGPALSVDKADAKVEPQSADHLALEVAARERRTVQWQRLHLSSGDIIERDTWGIDCYTRKNIELALGLVPAPLTMTRPQATFFIENVFLPAVNAVEDPTLAHDIQNTIKLLLDWYSGPAPHGTLDETGPPLPAAVDEQHAEGGQKREYIVAPIGEDTVCAVCGTSERPEEALLCDGPGCDKEFHMSCLNPPLKKVPEGDFIGPCCGGHGCGDASAGSEHGATQKKADEDAERMMEQAPARFVVRSDGERTWIPSLADPRAPRREQIEAGVRKIAAVCQDVGLLHFAIHPKGCGVICATDKTIPANRFVTEYLGSVYPAWKWAQKDREEEDQRKMERAQQQRLFLERAKARQAAGKNKLLQKNLDEEEEKVVFQVPEFYNIRLERNRSDPEGYDLLYVDAKDHAAFSSRMSHSCAPNCALEGTVLDGQYVIAVRTLRPIRPGEELTQDYNCVTESEEEFRAAVCLCGGVTCRGSFLNFTGATMASLLLKQHHTKLQRLGMLCTACHEADAADKKSSVDASGSSANNPATTDSSSAPAGKEPHVSNMGLVQQISSMSCLGTSALADQPGWSLRWCAAVLRFMNNERKFLPQELEEMQKIMKATGATIGAVENIRLAASVYEQRTSNLVTALDIIRHCVSSEAIPTVAPEACSKAADVAASSAPFRKLNGAATAEFLVHSERSVLRQTLRHTDNAIRAILRNKPDSVVESALSNPTPGLQQTVATVWSRLQQMNEKILVSWNRVEAELGALLSQICREGQSPISSTQTVPAAESSGLADNNIASQPTGAAGDQADQAYVRLLEASDILRQWANTILAFATDSSESPSEEVSSSSSDTIGSKATGITQSESNDSAATTQSLCGDNNVAPSAEKKTSSRKRSPKPTSFAQMATIADGVDAYSKTLESRRLDQVRAATGRAVHILRLYANTRNFYAVNKNSSSAHSGGSGAGAVALLQHAFQWFDQQRLDLVEFVQAVRLGGYLPPVYAIDSFDCCAKSAASAPAAAVSSTSAASGSEGSSANQSQASVTDELGSLSPGDLTRRLLGQGAGGIVASYDWSTRHFIPHMRTAPFDAVPSKLARALGFPAVAADAHEASLSGTSGTSDGPGTLQDASASRCPTIPVPIEKLVFGSPILDVVVEFEIAQRKAFDAKCAASREGSTPGGAVPPSRDRGRKNKGRDSARRFPSATCGAAYAEVLALLRESSGASAKIWAAKAKQRQEFKKQRALQAQLRSKSTLVLYHRNGQHNHRGTGSGTKHKVSFQGAHRLYCREQRAKAKVNGGFDPEKGPVLAQINNGWKALDAATREEYRRRAAEEAEAIDTAGAKKQTPTTKRKKNGSKASSGGGKAKKKRNSQEDDDSGTETPAPPVAMFWAQCEACKKWRSLPVKWNPETDFFCTDNKWDATRQTCDAPEEQWEQGGNYVVEVRAAGQGACMI